MKPLCIWGNSMPQGSITILTQTAAHRPSAFELTVTFKLNADSELQPVDTIYDTDFDVQVSCTERTS